MRPISRWAHLMSSTITFAPKTGVDAYGRPSYGTAVAYRTHLVQAGKMIRSASGQVIASNMQAYLNGAPVIAPTALATVSTADAGSTDDWAIHPAILSVDRSHDQYGPHHTIVYFGGPGSGSAGAESA